MRPPAVFHCTSQPYRFFGRRAELASLDEALAGGAASVVAFVGPGGQGKTAIVQQWLHTERPVQTDGIFFWSFYRGKDSDLCLREMYGYAERLGRAAEASASYCVDRLLPHLRRERWAIVLDGTEVVQHEQGSWRGRFLHPELGRLIEELASEPMPGVVVVTTRFELPTLERRRHARLVSLSTLDEASACHLLESLGVRGAAADLTTAARACGLHAKAVELLGTFLARYRGGEATASQAVLAAGACFDENASSEERHVTRVLSAFQTALSQEEKDIVALATAFRQPPPEERFLAYLQSKPVHQLLHETWGRGYSPFVDRKEGWLQARLQGLVDLRLLERVGLALSTEPSGALVLDAHPLVRRGFEDALGAEGIRHGARSRAGFLRGRPDRRPPATLEETRDEVELFHAYCDAGLWNEADSAYVALDNPKHRFLAPAFERDLLLRFFPGGDWRLPPLWHGFGRQRSLAICLEMLGQFEEALQAYRPADAALRGDALIALGRIEPILAQERAAAPWQTLWQAYRVHALALAGRRGEALREAGSLVPGDIYEWVHVFEGLLRLGRLDLLDVAALRYRTGGAENEWAELARRRMLADHERACGGAAAGSKTLERACTLEEEFRRLMEAYDRSGLSWERALVRLSLARLLQSRGEHDTVLALGRQTLELARRQGMTLLEVDALALTGHRGSMTGSSIGRP